MQLFEIKIIGVVQGVGFRPFIHKLAKAHGLKGYVLNFDGDVLVYVSYGEKIGKFVNDIKLKKPEGAFILDIEESLIEDSLKVKDIIGTEKYEKLVSGNLDSFEIVKSNRSSGKEKNLEFFPPDTAICSRCLKELTDKSNRRYHYPLITCATCGPRYSIIHKLPYDRERTVMDKFLMCDCCKNEYENILDVRHHAQTISCNDCGPEISFCESKIYPEKYEEFYEKLTRMIKDGKILGIKGTGGFQLVCDPFDFDAVKRLRKIKNRDKKPFAIMFSDVEEAEKFCVISEYEKALMESLKRPIVLCKKKDIFADSNKNNDIVSENFASENFASDDFASDNFASENFAFNVASESRYVGAFLPVMGLHKILLDSTGPLIVTSANDSGEPMIIDDEEFFDKFPEIDGVVTNNRDILTPMDDSVVFVIKTDDGKEHAQFVRRSRGEVPLPVILKERKIDNKNVNKIENNNEKADEKLTADITEKVVNPPVILAMGSDLKAAFCYGLRNNLVLSQFFGDLISEEITENYKKEIERVGNIYDIKPDVIVVDKHPKYISRQVGLELIQKVNKSTQPENVKNNHDEKESIQLENEQNNHDEKESIQLENEHIKLQNHTNATPIKLIEVQHHLAHTYSVMAENTLDSTIGISFDGTGFGDDEKLWGGECFYASPDKDVRSSHMSYVKLCGGDKISKNSYQTAVCYLINCGLQNDEIVKILNAPKVDEKMVDMLRSAMHINLNCIDSSSMGRLFDAVSAILNIRYENTYEGECAIQLEQKAYEFLQENKWLKDVEETDCLYYNNKSLYDSGDRNGLQKLYYEKVFMPEFEKIRNCLFEGKMISQEAIIKYCLDCKKSGMDISEIAYRFHLIISEVIVFMCENARQEFCENKVSLSGGTFANRLLLTTSISKLREKKFEVFWNQKVPSNDGGLALGQTYYAMQICNSE